MSQRKPSMHCNALPPKHPLKYVNFSMFVKLYLWLTAASKVSINDFHSAISPSNIFILIFANFTPIPPICQPKHTLHIKSATFPVQQYKERGDHSFLRTN